MIKLPSSWEEMTVPDEYYTTQDGGDFLILDEYVPGTLKKVWGWASDTGISVLKASSDIYGDGTFEVAKPTLFEQAWILIAKCERMNVSIPCAYFLLPDKQYNPYYLCLSKLKELGVTSPARFHLDFEAASIKAVRSVFGAATSLECCDTHWKRALRSHQQEVGLVPHINNQVEVQTFCRRLWALSFVPEEDIVHMYEKVILRTMPEFEVEEDEDGAAGGDDSVHNYNQALDRYLTYFEGTWVGAEHKKTKVRGKPKFTFDLWSKYKAVKEDRPDLTSNRSEAWNSASKVSIPMKPSIWVVCKSIQREEGLARAKLHAAIGASPPSDPHPGRTKKRLEKAQSLKKIVDQYGILPHNKYLDALVAHFNATS